MRILTVDKIGTKIIGIGWWITTQEQKPKTGMAAAAAAFPST